MQPEWRPSHPVAGNFTASKAQEAFVGEKL